MEKTMKTIKKCRVCGEKQTKTHVGFNFNGLSCESCKIFFRRTAHRFEVLSCQKGKCTINRVTRAYCQKCRLDKCFQIGMQKELIKRKLNQIDLTVETVTTVAQTHVSEIEPIQIVQTDRNLQQHELELINELQQAMLVFVDESKLEIVSHSSALVDAFNYPGYYIKKIVQFSKKLRAFQSLQQNDQVAMLKESYCYIQAIRFAFVFNLELDGFPCMLIDNNESQENKAILIKMCIFRQWRRQNVESFFRRVVYSLQMEMEGDVNVRNLLIAYALFKPKLVNVVCPEMIRYHHCIYGRLLERYLEHKLCDSAKASKKLSTLIDILEDVDKIDRLTRQMFCDIDSAQIIKVLNEIWGSTAV